MAVAEQKKVKRTKLVDAAYELFISKGIQETVIDDIVKKAGVAKGTFYLYFKDKYDLIDKMVLRKSTEVIDQALAATEKESLRCHLDFESKVLYFADYLVDYFGKNVELLTVIRKNLSRGVVIDETLQDDGTRLAVERFIQGFMEKGATRQEAMQTLYILVEMVGAVCCDAIVNQKPYKIEEIKPVLYRMVRKLLN